MEMSLGIKPLDIRTYFLAFIKSEWENNLLLTTTHGEWLYTLWKPAYCHSVIPISFLIVIFLLLISWEILCIVLGPHLSHLNVEQPTGFYSVAEWTRELLYWLMRDQVENQQVGSSQDFMVVQSSLVSVHPCIHPNIHPSNYACIQPCIRLSKHPSMHPCHAFRHAFVYPCIRPCIHLCKTNSSLFSIISNSPSASSSLQLLSNFLLSTDPTSLLC